MSIDPARKEDNNVALSEKRRKKKEQEVDVGNVCDLLECPVCSNIMYPPIHQCVNGHTICSSCKPRVYNRCPTCRHELGNIRCLALEKAAASVVLPCKHQCYGCVGVYPYNCKLEHESQCEYRPYSCPFPGSNCAASGDVPYLVEHLKDVHVLQFINKSAFRHRFYSTCDSYSWVPTVISCLGQYFCLHFEKLQLGKDAFYITFLRFMGDYSESTKYSYTLEVGGGGRKMMWEGVPRSIRDSHTTVLYSYDGLLIKEHIALFFSDGDKRELNLKLTGRIWKI